MKRRDFLRLVGATGIAAAGLGACGDNEAPGPTSAAAIFEPTASSFLVSVWSTTSRLALVTVSRGGVVTRVERVPVAAGGVVDITGLDADAAHEVTIATDDGIHLGPHHVRTAPADDATRPIRIAVSADWDPAPEFASDLVDHLVAAQPELYVSIGDFPYTDNGPVAKTVDAYRARHLELRAEPRTRMLHEAIAMRAIYDDHEFRNDWDAGLAAVEPARYAAAMQVWDEMFPLRGAAGDVRYRRWRWGANVECFVLDCRRFRSANAARDDAGKTMLGATQLRWLLDGLASSTATFKLVFTSVPLAFGNGVDHWAGFTTERGVIFDAIIDKQLAGVLFVSGDQHWFAAHRHDRGIREFQIGPVARGLGTPPPPVPGVLFRAVRLNAGLIDVAGDRLTFTGLGADGTHFYRETVTADDLRPTRFPHQPG